MSVLWRHAAGCAPSCGSPTGWPRLTALLLSRAPRPAAAGHSELQFYLSLFNMQLPIESQYVQTVPDNLNAGVQAGQGQIWDVL